MKRIGALILIALAMGACSRDNPPPGEPTPPPMTTPPPPPPPPPVAPLIVIDELGQPLAGYEILVNTDRGRSDWLSTTSEGFLAAYPSGQAWGFVAAVLSGDPTPGRRPFRDVSMYKTFHIQLRGRSGGETVDIGIKDNTDPDTGSETKKRVVLTTTAWQTLEYPLTDFTTADLKRIYLLFEIVFDGGPGRSVYFRDVKYLP